MDYRIMIVEDDLDIANLLSTFLERFGFLVYTCSNFTKVDEEFKEQQPHLVLLDVNLPAYDGFYWCMKLRKISSCPIIFLSARNTDLDQVHAMMSGGDDYITKPFSFELLNAKISAILRRSYGEYATLENDELICGDCVYSKSKLTLQCHGEISELSKTEAAVIRKLFQHFPNVVYREDLLNEIWDDSQFVDENTLNVTISRIRRRFEQIKSTNQIKAIRGLGYKVGGIRTDE
ncbi:MAG: response regulator transcription factor [Erysipelotrichaceae bacterium]